MITDADIQVKVITPIAGEPGRFFAPSDTDADPWLVDLNENAGRGACSCQIIHCRHTSGCKHIERVREWVDTKGTN